ncbi:MAG TPA: LPS export ABC transporter permease LptG [Rhodanobacteraceae bacterium]|nr:LPS export ABC transporter permease LptG [Rhodanobacteraceae bacterium]
MSVGVWQRIRIKRVDWLIAITVLGGLLLTWLVLTGLDAFIQFAGQIGNIGHNGYTLGNAVVYIMLTIPRRAYEWFVFAAVIGSLVGIGALATTGELTALRAAGMSKLRICLSVTGLVFVLMIGVFILGETVAPAGDARAQQVQLQRAAGQLHMRQNGGLWARDGNNIINAKAALAHLVNGRPAVELADVRVFGFNDANELVSFRNAKLATQAGKSWTLHDVRDTRVSAEGAVSTTHAQQPWKTSLDPEVLETSSSVFHPEYLSLRDLSRNIGYMRANRQNPSVYLNAYWTRVFYPLNTLLLVLCALPFGFGALRSGGLGKRLFLGVIVAIAWYFIQRAIISTGTVFGAPPFVVNLIPALLLLAIAIWYYRRV